MNTDYQNTAPLDGNAGGGLLRELFALDLTAAEITCGGCGTVAALGALHLYGFAMGAVFRCAHCNTAMLRLSHTPEGIFLDMHGTQRLFVAAGLITIAKT